MLKSKSVVSAISLDCKVFCLILELMMKYIIIQSEKGFIFFHKCLTILVNVFLVHLSRGASIEID